MPHRARRECTHIPTWPPDVPKGNAFLGIGGGHQAWFDGIVGHRMEGRGRRHQKQGVCKKNSVGVWHQLDTREPEKCLRPVRVMLHHVVAVHDLGGVMVVVVDMEEARSAAGCPPASQSTEGSATSSRELPMTTTLTLAHTFCPSLYDQSPGLQCLTA